MHNTIGKLIYILYCTLGIISYPFLLTFLLYRLFVTKKENKKSFYQKIGFAPLPNLKNTIWFHAASVGESLAILPIIEQLHNIDKLRNIIITTGTITSARIMNQRLPNKVQHFFIPLDILPIIRCFISKINPSILILVESDLWPTLIVETARKCPVIILNGRISDKSVTRWLNASAFIKYISSNVKQVVAVSTSDVKRFKSLKFNSIEYLPNMKLIPSAKLNYDEDKLKLLQTELKGKKIVVAASVHPGEEKFLLELYNKMQKSVKNLLFIIVPRHPNKWEDIIKNINLNIAVRSKNNTIKPDTNWYLMDTMGELGIAFNIGKIVIMGGSFIPHGGQNPLEPLRFGCDVICGPYMYNFNSIMEVLLNKNSIWQVREVNETSKLIQKLFANTNRKKSVDIFVDYKNLFQQYLDYVFKYIK